VLQPLKPVPDYVANRLYEGFLSETLCPLWLTIETLTTEDTEFH